MQSRRPLARCAPPHVHCQRTTLLTSCPQPLPCALHGHTCQRHPSTASNWNCPAWRPEQPRVDCMARSPAWPDRGQQPHCTGEHCAGPPPRRGQHTAAAQQRAWHPSAQRWDVRCANTLPGSPARDWCWAADQAAQLQAGEPARCSPHQLLVGEHRLAPLPAAAAGASANPGATHWHLGVTPLGARGWCTRAARRDVALQGPWGYAPAGGSCGGPAAGLV